MTKKRLLILSVSAGAGHLRAAEALKAWAIKDYPDLDVIHLDVMTCINRLFRFTYVNTYLTLVRRLPRLWGYLYEWSDKDATGTVSSFVWGSIERLNLRPLQSLLSSLDPDVIICTHFLPAQWLSRMIHRGKWARPVWVQVTDFDVHQLWIHSNLTGYFAGNSEVAAKMQKRGLTGSQIHVTGIPIMPVFNQAPDRETCANELGIDSRKQTILLMSGGMGLTGLDTITKELLSLPGDFQIIAVAGKNTRLQHHLNKLAKSFPTRLTVVGYTQTIERLMTCADLTITKAGGLTTSECLAMHLPMLITNPIPGQEEHNADYLLENQAALIARETDSMTHKLRNLLKSPDRLITLKQAASNLATPRAAQSVLKIVLNGRHSKN